MAANKRAAYWPTPVFGFNVVKRLKTILIESGLMQGSGRTGEYCGQIGAKAPIAFDSGLRGLTEA